MSTNHYLIERWRKCNLESPPYLFPDDTPEIIDRFSKLFLSFDEYTASPEFGASSDISLQTGLLPMPYAGDITKATIFILMLNPGLSPVNYFAEQIPDFRQAHIQNLMQKDLNENYPFIFLDPHFAWHSGFGYWQRKFHAIIRLIAKKEGIRYQEAMRQLSQRLACLELVPYRSKSFGARLLLNKLPSAQAMLSYVNEIVLPKVEADKAIIIATRSVKNWMLPVHKNIVIYEGGETRSAHLTPASRGGKAIALQLGL